jgi:predicted N-acyltransferase
LLGNIEYELLPDRSAVLVGMKPVLNGQEVTDYGEMENSSKESVVNQLESLKNKFAISTVQFDYIRQDSQLFQILSKITSIPPTLQEVAPFISLPKTWEEYLETLERTDRKELKRKIKRLDTILHEFRIVETPIPNEDFDSFVSLHKLSDHSKEMFMSEPMQNFFRDISSAQFPGWEQKMIFMDIEGKAAASIFYFENENSLLLYNSGYDPNQKYYSVGLLLCAHLIHRAIEENKKTFDFLRGNERYKYDLGGVNMNLYKFVISLD